MRAVRPWQRPLTRRGVRRGVTIVAIALLPVAYAVGCVDGMTPDCSDVATQCGPNLDGSFDGEGGDAPSSETAAADGAADVVQDAAADADAFDAGDGD